MDGEEETFRPSGQYWLTPCSVAGPGGVNFKASSFCHQKRVSRRRGVISSKSCSSKIIHRMGRGAQIPCAGFPQAPHGFLPRSIHTRVPDTGTRAHFQGSLSWETLRVISSEMGSSGKATVYDSV